jgi:hypothetical protein
MKLTLDPFTRAYIHAALWTEDPHPPGGMDYAECGAAEYNLTRLPAYWIEQAVADCAAFQRDNAELLSLAGSAEQNGHDFWLTRNRHGAGFWDRGYPDTAGDALTEAAEAYGEAYLDWSELTEEEE